VPSTKPIAMAGTALRIGPTVGMNSRSPAMKPRAKAAFTPRTSISIVVTTPMTTIAMSWTTSHSRSTVAISVSTTPARARGVRGGGRVDDGTRRRGRRAGRAGGAAGGGLAGGGGAGVRGGAQQRREEAAGVPVDPLLQLVDRGRDLAAQHAELLGERRGDER